MKWFRRKFKCTKWHDKLAWFKHTLIGYTVVFANVNYNYTVIHRPFRQPIMKSSKLYFEMKLTRKHPKTGELLDNSSRLLSVLRQSTTDGRLDSLLSVVDDTSENIIVYYNYISERKAILKALAKTDKHILRYDGEVHDKLPASDANISNTVLVAHYKSASTGLNLQWANVTVYFSPTYSYGEFEQSIGRTHRQGQSKKCLYYLFNVKNTVDRDIWECLREKRDFNVKLWKDQ